MNVMSAVISMIQQKITMLNSNIYPKVGHITNIVVQFGGSIYN